MQLEPDKKAALQILDRLEEVHADAAIALRFSNPWELLVATILSAQCTDQRVNQVTADLFRRYPDVAALARADLGELEQAVRPTGFFRNKAKALKECAIALREEHGGRVPDTLAALTALPGVGRKTANVILGNAFGIPGMVVDTHVRRVAIRLGWTRRHDPVKIEADLAALLPESRWIQASHVLIFHGRRICKAPRPWCSQCPVVDACPQVGVDRPK